MNNKDRKKVCELKSNLLFIFLIKYNKFFLFSLYFCILFAEIINSISEFDFEISLKINIGDNSVSYLYLICLHVIF